MLRKDIKVFPHKLQTVHKLEEEDNDRRLEMCETLLNQLLHITPGKSEII